MLMRPNLRHATVLLVAMALAFPWAQATDTLLGDGYHLEIPRGWPVEREVDDGAILYFVSSPGGEGGLIAAVAPLDGPERAAYEAQGLTGLIDLSSALIADLPGVQRGEPMPTTVAGFAAMGFPFAGGDLAGRFVYLVADERLYVLGSLAEPSGAQLVGHALDQMVASFVLTSAGHATGNDGGGATPPNPLGGGQLGTGGNPLAAAAFTGTFVGDGLTLSLERGGDGYVGSLTYQGQTYPVTARDAGPGALAGQFVSGGDAFAFDLLRAGDHLTLTTGSSSFALR